MNKTADFNQKSDNRKRLTVFILVVALISSIIIMAIIIFQGNRLQNNLASQEINNALRIQQIKYDEFTDKVETTLSICRSYASSGLFYNRTIEELNAFFTPILSRTPEVHSLEIVNNLGVEYTLYRENNKWINKIFLSDTTQICDFRIYSQHLELLKKKDTLMGNRFIEIDDYKLLRDSLGYDEIYWSRPGSMAGHSDKGVFGSVKVKAEKINKEYILSVNVSMYSLLSMLDSIPFTNEVRIFAFTKEKRTFFKPEKDTFSVVQPMYVFLTEAGNIQDSLLKQAVISYPVENQDSLLITKMNIENNNWWIGYSQNTDSDNIIIYGIAIPEEKLLDILSGRRGAIFVIVSVIMLFSAVLIVLLYKNLGTAKSFNFPDTGNITSENLQSVISLGESKKLEFKSTVRMNIKAGKPGKEIEIAWLKSVVAFLNSNGGNILLGVSDDGQIIGIEQDGFANDDKCLLHLTNLIKQHIGLEFANYIIFRLVKSGTKTVVVVHCQPTKEPVFLRNGDKEQFYIRSGPSSVELSVSKVLKYIEDRKRKDI